MQDPILSLIAESAKELGASQPRPASQAGGVDGFVQQYGPLAQRVGGKIGVEPAVLLGQWGLETGWGRSVIPGTNNLGNIKDFTGAGPQATDNMTGSRDSYRAYESPDSFGEDFAGLIARRYRTAAGSGSDAGRYFAELKKGGYAEDPDYVNKGVAAARMAANAMGGSLAAAPPQQPTSRFGGPRSEMLDPRPPAPTRSRGVFEAINDTVIEFGNAVAGAAGAVGSFVSPGNQFSQAVEEFIQSGVEKQSDVVRAEKERLAADMEAAPDASAEVTTMLGYMARNPALTAAQVAGSFVLPGAAVKGASSFAQAVGVGARGAARAGLAGGAVAGATMGGGDAAGTAYELVMKSPDDVILQSPDAQQLIRQGITDPAQIKEAIAQKAAAQARVLPAILGAATGVIGAERLLAGLPGAGRTRVGNALATGGIEGSTEAVEEAATVIEGQRAAAQYNPEIDSTKGAAGAATMGFVGGAGVGAVAGALQSPELAPVIQKAQEPNSPLSKSAVAGTAASPPVAPVAPVDPAARLAELEAKSKGTPDRVVTGPDGRPMTIPGTPGGFFTASEKGEYDALIAQRDATPGAKPDELAPRLAAVKSALNPGVLDALRAEGSDYTAKDLLKDLAIAQSRSAQQTQREQALSRIETGLEWAGANPAPTIEPNIDEITGTADGEIREPGARAPIGQLRAGVDRDAELIAQRDGTQAGRAGEALRAEADRLDEASLLIVSDPKADDAAFERANDMRSRAHSLRQRAARADADAPAAQPGVGIQRDRELIDAQRQVNMERRLGARPAPPAPAPAPPPAPVTPAEQGRLEAAALGAKVNERRRGDEARRVVIDRALRNVEERVGVASPAEAQIFAEAGLGKPYDRIDESLAPPPSTDERLTQATGIALGRRPRETVVPGRQDDAALASAEQKAVVDAARARMTAEQMRVLQDAAVNPANLSATDKLQLQQMREARNSGGGAAIMSRARGLYSGWRIATQLAGMAKRWYRPHFDDLVASGAADIDGRKLRDSSPQELLDFLRRLEPVNEHLAVHGGGQRARDLFRRAIEELEAGLREDTANKSAERRGAEPEASALTSSEPAVIRKRRRQLDKLAEDGYETVERRDGVFFIRNSRTGDEVRLSGRADAALARAAVKARADGQTAAQRMVGEKIDGDWSRFSKASGTLGIPRAEMPQVKAEHRGAMANFMAARGVALTQEEVAPNTLKATQAEVSPQRARDAADTDGDRAILVSSDGHILDGHHQWMAALEAGRPVRVIRLDAPIQRLIELAREFPSSTMDVGAAPATNDAAEATTDTPLADGPAMAVEPDRAPGTTFTVRMDGKNVEFKRADVSQLAETESPERDGKARRISRKSAKLISAIGAAMGKRVQFFEDISGTRVGDGFVKPEEPDTIYLNTVSTINPLAVFGHEFLHTLRITNPKAWDAIAAVVKTRVKNPKGFRQDYYGAEIAKKRGNRALSGGRGGELEELVSDLGGNLMADPSFWREVFAKIDADNGKDAKGIIARLIAQLQALIDMAVGAVKGPAFRALNKDGASPFVDDMAAVRAAFRDGLAEYLKDSGQSKAGMQAEILKSSQSAQKSAVRESAIDSLVVDGRFNGMRVYGDWFEQDMLARAKRNKIDVKDLHLGLIQSRSTMGGTYATRGYFYVVPQGVRTYVWDKDNKPVYTLHDGVMVFTRRRDGKVQSSGHADPMDVVLASEPLDDQVRLSKARSVPKKLEENFVAWSGGIARSSVVTDASPGGKHKFKTGEPFVASVFHGSPNIFDEFKNERLGENTGAKSATLGHFAAGSAGTSESYTGGFGGDDFDSEESLTGDVSWDGSGGPELVFTADGGKWLKVADHDPDEIQKDFPDQNFTDADVEALREYQSYVEAAEEMSLGAFGLEGGVPMAGGSARVNTQEILEQLEREGLVALTYSAGVHYGEMFDSDHFVIQKESDGTWAVSRSGTLVSIEKTRRAAEQAANDELQSQIEMRERGDDSQLMNLYLRSANPLVHDYKGKSYREISYAKVISAAKKNGHDAVVLLNTFDGGPKDNIFVFFDPNQVKSSIGNDGSYSRASNNIYKSPERGIHFSKQQRNSINGAYYGTGLKGLEAERLRASDDPRLKTRVYFYVDEGNGVRPEAGVGGYAHEVELPKLYDAKANAEKLWNSGDLNGTESRILDAGYAGYFVKKHETGQGLAVVIGDAAKSMPAKPIANPKIAGPISTGVPETIKAAPSSKEIDLIEVGNIPGATLRAGMLRFPADSREQANAEMARIGSDLRFSKERLSTPAEEIEAVRKRYSVSGSDYIDRELALLGPDESNANGSGANAKHLANAGVSPSLISQGLSLLHGPGFSIDSVDTVLAQRLWSNADAFGDVLDLLSGSGKGFRKLNVKGRMLVQDGMVLAGQNSEIRRSIVESIPVDVVNLLAGKNISTDSLLRDHAVFKDSLFADGDSPVPSLSDVALLSIVGNPAVKGAEVLAGALGMARLSKEALVAVRTGYFDGRLPASPRSVRLASRVEDFPWFDVDDAHVLKFSAQQLVALQENPWLKAPNGKATNLTERQWLHVRTPSFKKWFGDFEKFDGAQGGVWADDNGEVSKVVDSNGEPMVVYHGTDKGGFASFRRPGGKKRGDLGIFTTDNLQMARTYVHRGRGRILVADEISEEDNDGGSEAGVYALFLNIREPNEDDFEGANWDGSREGMYMVVGEDGDAIYADDGRSYFADYDEALSVVAAKGGNIEAAQDHYNDTDSVVRGAQQSRSQDGAIIRSVRDEGGGYNASYYGDPSDLFVALEPNQVKSADFNDGTYSVDEDDIRRSAAREPRERVHGFEVSTREPYAKPTKDFAPEDSRRDLLISDFASGLGQSKWLAAVTELVEGYPNYRAAATANTPEKKLERTVRQLVENLLWLHDQVPADTRNRSRLWYDGARAIAERWSRKYSISDAQAAGILAVLSPQKDWFMNVSLANRVADIMTDRQAFRWSKQMDETSARIFGKEAYQEDIDAIRGQTLQDLDDAYLRAMWLRVYDQAHNPSSFYIVSPEGDFVAEARTKDGTLGRVAWGGNSTIAKAVSVFENGSFENISTQLGRKHKVRNFYNNILVPNSPNGHVTIDTHAVAAALLRPLSGNSIEVMHNFGGPKSAHAGLEGTYAMYEEAYRRAAAERGILPREMQSITWEAVRGMFVPTFKAQRRNVEAVDSVWTQFQKGRLSYENARKQVLELAGGIEAPSWSGRDPGAYVEDEPAADDGDLAADGVPAGDSAADGGDSGRRAGASARRSRARDRERGDEGRSLAPLAGAPSIAGATGPDPRLVEVAERYAASRGVQLRRQADYVKVDPERARRIAEAYEAMPHAPQDPAVKAAYQDLIQQTRAQYDALVDAGYKFWFMDPEADPYAGNPWNAMRDLRANQRMAVFPTEAGFGTSDFDPAANPLLADTGLEWGFGSPEGKKKRVLANDLFRAVHDAFGHGLEGAGFRADGEENAWQAHVRLFTGPAVGAITSETRGQNSALNFSSQPLHQVIGEHKARLLYDEGYAGREARGQAGDAQRGDVPDLSGVPGVRGVERDDVSLLQPKGSELPALRGAGNNGGSGAADAAGLSGRDGVAARPGVSDRPDRQQRQLRAGESALGNGDGERAEQAKQPPGDAQRPDAMPFGVGARDRGVDSSALDSSRQVQVDRAGGAGDAAGGGRAPLWKTITVGEHNRSAKVADTVFADQKTGLMPEWTWTEGRADDEPGATMSPARDATLEDFKPAGIGRLLDLGNWAIMTAENPGGNAASAAYNRNANASLRKDLVEIGAQLVEITGRYGGPTDESSFAVVGIAPEDALRLGRQYDQESVLTRDGLVYQDGTRNPATGVEVFRKAPKDYFSRIGDTIFRLNIDFDRRLPAAAPPADLIKIFEDMRSSPKARKSAKAAAAAHPLSARIQEIETNFYDILDELEGSKVLSINCD